MLIGKSHVLSLVVFLCVGCKTTQTETLSPKPNEAWWVSEEFTPSGTNIKGIPVSQIMPDWKYATLIDKIYLKKRLSADQFRDISQSNLKFNVQASLVNTPNDDTFVVGVYEALSGEKGRFIAIFRNSEFIKLFTDAESSGYSSIYLEGNQIRWYKCMECSNFDLILWSGSDYILQ